MNKMMTILVSN